MKVPHDGPEIILWIISVLVLVSILQPLRKALSWAYKGLKKIMSWSNKKGSVAEMEKKDVLQEKDYQEFLQRQSLGQESESEWLKNQILEMNHRLRCIEDRLLKLESIDETLREISYWLQVLAKNGPESERNTFADSGRKSNKPTTRWPEPEVSGAVVTAARRNDPYRQDACRLYQVLADNGLRAGSADLIFAVLDMESSGPTRSFGKEKFYFRTSEKKQSAFVVFRKENSKEGYLFPNPIIAFTEAMKYIFPDLTYDGFETSKSRIEPVSVSQVGKDSWELIGN